MTAVLFVAAAFALGLFLGALVSVARDYYDEQAGQDAERDALVAQWRHWAALPGAKGAIALGWTCSWIPMPGTLTSMLPSA